MKTTRPLITLTGADERTDLLDLRKLNAEIGFLYTYDSESRNRYPSVHWILNAAKSVPHAALHVCGSRARAVIAAGALDLDNFMRIQVNGKLFVEEVENLCKQYPSHTIITQHNQENDALLQVTATNHAILVDSSGGRGRTPAAWARPNTTKAYGFAGGFGPDNLAAELPVITQLSTPGKTWVDMEGKLRIDDWFSIDRAQQCIEIFDRWQAHEIIGTDAP